MKPLEMLKFTMEHRDLVWDDEMIIKLIRKIELHRSLWDTNDVDYRNIIKKRLIYTEIGKEFGCCGSVVERKWRDLRNQYRREKLKNDESTWFALDPMRFVDGQNSNNSLVVTQKVSPVTHQNPSSPYVNASKWQKRKYPSANIPLPLNDQWTSAHMLASLHSNNRDEFEIYAEGVATKLRKIQDPRMQLNAQRIIDNTLYDALMKSAPKPPPKAITTANNTQ
ncbi:uncharacterized protein [Eurosta solidaginis]|uniref:uncharacterized protein n=1 Tax=Eurosta solidaginis TaxID=178769 RepID=UPI003530F43B